MNKNRESIILIEDLPNREQPEAPRELQLKELLQVVGGRLERMSDSGYMCSAPSNDCSKA